MPKNSAAVNYKFRDLKVFGPADPLAESKRRYQQVLEESGTTYIYAELSLFNKRFDEEDWNVKVNLKAYHASGKEICDLKVERIVKADENIIYFREGWGNPSPGSFWKKEQYYWEAWVDGVLVVANKVDLRVASWPSDLPCHLRCSGLRDDGLELRNRFGELLRNWRRLPAAGPVGGWAALDRRQLAELQALRASLVG